MFLVGRWLRVADELLSKFPGRRVAKVSRPGGMKDVLQRNSRYSKEFTNAGVGVGDDGPSFLPRFLSLHHDVAVGEGF